MANRNLIGESQVKTIVDESWGVVAESVAFIPEGVSTTNWHVTTLDHEGFIFRDCGAYGDSALFQCDIWHALGTGRFPYEVPQPLVTARGKYVVNAGDSNFILYPYIRGVTADTSTDLAGRDMGLMLAGYHGVVESMNLSGYTQLRSKDLLTPNNVLPHILDVTDRVGAKSGKSEVDKAFLATANGLIGSYIRMAESIDSRAYGELPRIPCHGDFKPQNTLLRDGRLVGLIDLGGVVIDPKILDIQYGISTTAFGPEDFDETTAHSFLEGYLERADISEAEMSLVFPLMYADTVRRLCWQLQELCSEQGRIQLEDAAANLQKACAIGRMLCVGQVQPLDI